jgi:hypothetical protein
MTTRCAVKNVLYEIYTIAMLLLLLLHTFLTGCPSQRKAHLGRPHIIIIPGNGLHRLRPRRRRHKLAAMVRAIASIIGRVALYPSLHPVLMRLPLLIQLPLGRTVAVIATLLPTAKQPLVLLSLHTLLLLLWLLPLVGILIARQELLVHNSVHFVLVGGDGLNAEVVGAEGVVVVIVCLWLLECVEL